MLIYQLMEMMIHKFASTDKHLLYYHLQLLEQVSELSYINEHTNINNCFFSKLSVEKLETHYHKDRAINYIFTE